MISIVIPAYNEEKFLGDLLQSLTQLTGTEQFEVIVVDNASTDRTTAIAQSFMRALPLTVLYEPHKGRGAARAAGFAAAQGEFIFSTDADAVVPADWIQTIIPYFSDTTVLAVTGTCRIHDSGWFRNLIFNFVQPTVMLLYRLVYGHFWLTGSNFAIRKTAYGQVGGFARGLNAMEDMELGAKINQLGRIALTHSAAVTVSGRRFQENMWRGYFAYVSSFWQHSIRKKTTVVLDDTR